VRDPTLFLNRDPSLGWLIALEYGLVGEGQPPGTFRLITGDFAWYTPKHARRPRGFQIRDLDEIDVHSAEHEQIWEGPRFAAPLLGLDDATAGEIIVCARAHFGDEPSVNRAYFQAAVDLSGREALDAWRCCLEAGDGMAHFALGYTLFELGRHQEAYSHLRHYTELAPHSSWNWCWLGKAAAAIGETTEAEQAYHRALELTSQGDMETDARELLQELEAGR
jgi:tetratricopeptide (TPR) repeat protein